MSVFLSHAFEDKEEFVRQLAETMRSQGVDVWYDNYSLKAGDGLRTSIERGLNQCSYGIVVLSKAFFEKHWTQYELDILHERRMQGQDVPLIPIWLRVSKDYVERHSPGLATIVGIQAKTPDDIPNILRRLRSQHPAMWPQLENVAIQKTGIEKLDLLLGGGLPKPSSIVLKGPASVGKTIFAVSIQLHAMNYGAGGLYISYKENPIDILNLMQNMGADVEKFIKRNLLRVFDAFSARHQIAEFEVIESLPKEWRGAIEYVKDPLNVDVYMHRQIEVLKKIGFGGVNVIDSVDERMEMFRDSPNPKAAAKEYFQKMRSKLVRISQQTAIHICQTPENALTKSTFTGRQDGELKMRFRTRARQEIRELRVASLRGSPHDNAWHEYIITNDGVKIFTT